MNIRLAHLVLIGYVILFDKIIPTETSALNGHTLAQVLNELEYLKLKVNTCEDNVKKLENEVNTKVDKLTIASYEQRLNNMEDKLLLAQENLQTTEEHYKNKLAQADSKLRAVEKELQAFKELNDRLTNVEDLTVDFNLKTKESGVIENTAYSNVRHMTKDPSGQKLSEINEPNVPDSVNGGNVEESTAKHIYNGFVETEVVNDITVTETKDSSHRNDARGIIFKIIGSKWFQSKIRKIR